MARTTITLICDRCGCEFQRTPSEARKSRNGSYCSKFCSHYGSGGKFVVPDLDEAWGNWFAGLIDGEGCFHFEHRQSPGTVFIFSLQIALRDDDLAILEEIQRNLGFGSIYRYPASSGYGRNANPKAVYKTTSMPQAEVIVEIFKRFPLRAKKSRDLIVWTEGLQEALKGPGRDVERLIFLHEHLLKTRRYGEFD